MSFHYNKESHVKYDLTVFTYFFYTRLSYHLVFRKKEKKKKLSPRSYTTLLLATFAVFIELWRRFQQFLNTSTIFHHSISINYNLE